MNYSRRILPRLMTLICAALLFGMGEVQAKRVPKLYTLGPVNSEVGPIKKGALDAQPSGVSAQLKALAVDTVGFNYQHFGLFWLDIWSWGGKYTVYNKASEAYYEVTKAQAAAFLGIKESELKEPLSYHVPWGLVVIAGLVLLKFLPRFLAMRRQSRPSPAFQQPSAPAWTPPAGPPAGGPPSIPPPLPPEEK